MQLYDKYISILRCSLLYINIFLFEKTDLAAIFCNVYVLFFSCIAIHILFLRFVNWQSCLLFTYARTVNQTVKSFIVLYSI